MDLSWKGRSSNIFSDTFLHVDKWKYVDRHFLGLMVFGNVNAVSGKTRSPTVGQVIQQPVENYVEPQVFNDLNNERSSGLALVLDVLDDVVYKIIQVSVLLDSSSNAVYGIDDS